MYYIICKNSSDKRIEIWNFEIKTFKFIAHFINYTDNNKIISKKTHKLINYYCPRNK